LVETEVIPPKAGVLPPRKAWIRASSNANAPPADTFAGAEASGVHESVPTSYRQNDVLPPPRNA